MENNEEKNTQDEVIDSLAKKVTQLENRQQKVEELNLSTLPQKLKELETKVTETTNMRILDYSKHLERFDKQLNGFAAKIDAIPKEVRVKTTLQFDTKSKFVIKIILYMGLAILVLLATVISLRIEISRRADDKKNRYIIVQGLFPKTARYVDSVYINNEDSLVKVAKNNIEEQQKLIDAAVAAKETAEQAKQAEDNLQKLNAKKHPEKKRRGKK
jgi:hypothetical protein